MSTSGWGLSTHHSSPTLINRSTQMNTFLTSSIIQVKKTYPSAKQSIPSPNPHLPAQQSAQRSTRRHACWLVDPSSIELSMAAHHLSRSRMHENSVSSNRSPGRMKKTAATVTGVVSGDVAFLTWTTERGMEASAADGGAR